jgi:polysaccharide biosynthesis protein PslH
MSRVVSIVPYTFLPAKIGGQKGIALFNEYFGQYTDLTCLTVKNNENEQARNYEAIKVFSSSRLRYANPLSFFKIRKILRQKKATHILIEHPYFGWLGFLLKKTCSLPLIVHSHNIESSRFKTLGKWWWPILFSYEKWTHRRADYNFFIHEADRQYAIHTFGLQPSRCLVVTYGINRNTPPSAKEKREAREMIASENGIKEKEWILLFNGSFNYGPNVDALKAIADEICPLLDLKGFPYKVIVCGPWLKDTITPHPRLIIKGFVPSIETYFTGADIFINPVIDGGGIKTKLVEALGFNCNAVSTVDGANGVDPALCNGKLLLAGNGNWLEFTEKILAASSNQTTISNRFYEHFYWGYNTERAAAFIEIKK